MKKIFEPLSREKDHELLQTDDAQFSHTVAYIEPLILSALSLFRAPEEEKNAALRNLLRMIPVAAKRFLDNQQDADYKFSTYFGWYISEEVKKYNWARIDGK